MRSTEEIIGDIKVLVKAKGYIYAFCMILFENSYIDPEELQRIDLMERLNTNEASLLLGFLIQNQLDFSIPVSPEYLIQLKQKTYELMKELHKSFTGLFFEKLKLEHGKKHGIEDSRKERKEFFGKGGMLIEPIFYSGTGVYDFQYLDFLEKKYKYDKKWLIKNKNFDIEKSKDIVVQIKNILQEKAKKIHLHGLKEKIPQIVEGMKKKYPNEDWKAHIKEMLQMLELYQYKELFFEYISNDKELNMDKIREEGWKSFYKGLIELFIIRKSDFGKDPEIASFFDNFSISLENGLNIQFQGIGSFNLINAKPIIQLDDERYFVPVIFLLFEAIYETPFYWMWKDKFYRNQLCENRGKVGEEIVCELLSQVFGKSRSFKSVKIRKKTGQDVTDIDVLCVLGSKALCVQVKSKKLTVLSRMGNDAQLQKDFQLAVKDAYKQCLISREEILAKSASFFDINDDEIHLSEKIDEVYLMGIITENYPSLTHQSHEMIDKKNDDPFPMFSTIFNLELITHYLSDPYDFLYYIKQRTSLMDFFKADEEMAYLGYHLCQKLRKIPNVDLYVIDTNFAQLIDRNYYPLKAGLKVSDEGDIIKNKWKDEDFDRLCNQLKTIGHEKITNIIFYLLDLSREIRGCAHNLMSKKPEFLKISVAKPTVYLYKENGEWKYTFVYADKKSETGKFTNEWAIKAINTAIKDKIPDNDNKYQLTFEEKSILNEDLQKETSYHEHTQIKKTLVEYIIQTKKQTLKDRKPHNFSFFIPTDDSCLPHIGVTYISLNTDDSMELSENLLALCQARKYKSKCDAWIGFGSIKSSHKMIDMVFFNERKWEYDSEQERRSKIILEGKGYGKQIRIRKKIGRNERCPCGSGLKYKKCCLN